MILALLPRSPLTGFLGISLFSTTSETRHEAADSTHFKAAVIERSLWDWGGSQKREKADLLVTFPSNDCVPPGNQLQQILGSPVWLYHAVCSAKTSAETLLARTGARGFLQQSYVWGIAAVLVCEG